MADGQLRQLATEAWLYGYPLVTAGVTKDVMTAVAARDDDRRKAPVNQFCYMRRTPDASFTEVVSPNADTLYSSAWLDLSEEPLVLSLPDFGDRFWMVPILNAWSDVVAVPGRRQNGATAGPFLLVGPSWSGSVPDGMTVIQSSTAVNWIIARYATAGPSDFAAVNQLQDGTRLTPLSQWTGNPDDYSPPVDAPVAKGIDAITAPVSQVHQLDGAAYFTRLNQLMVDNPPNPDDTTVLDRLARLGIAPGASIAEQPEEILEVLEAAAAAGPATLQAFKSQAESPDHQINGWTIHRGLGNYGTDYAKRAMVTWLGYGANLDVDALYPHATTDADGNPLDGTHQYVLHFESGQTPPVQGFWSLTMMNDQQLFADNPLDRYAIGDRSNMRTNSDGTLDVYIQHENPGPERESNWLPAPEGSFNIFLRLYWPKEVALADTWTPPPLKRAN
ncbi:hypothetical protein B0675_26730 [Streptomyces sp. M41(2017)]|uniref:DUF1254 domain-containing protein n=1 Tax=Streptomyces sp. M41(2017) TaxID=1955065 RepID=UPI0009BEF592|nr:DUF1254 domain-containing protein [Streptomyces sp. M41(2017)]OQQ13826.1 hypothetical protein B0675_26730 [Streptomyces sp. M41(2017)]